MPNDNVTPQPHATYAESIGQAKHVINGTEILRAYARRVPLRMWALLLLVIVIGIAGNAYTVDQTPERPEVARPLPLLLLMTETPVRRHPR